MRSNSYHQAIVVEDDHGSLPPVRSNVNLDQPLRPKPPPSDLPQRPSYEVTPRPNYSGYNQYGVENPGYHSDRNDHNDHDLQKTAGSKVVKVYGPDDFITETVQLDKAYFHQFFTSKPLLLGTDVVTSTSVKDGGTTLLRTRDPGLKKQGRMEGNHNHNNINHSKSNHNKSNHNKPEKKEEKMEEELFHPEDQPSAHSLLERMVLVHKNMRTTTASTTTTTTRRTTTVSVTEVPSKILDNVKIFKRYHLPSEVKISHSLKYGG